MAINLIDWIEQYDTQEQKSKYKIIACEEGHSTSLDEMDRLGTHGFCPKCSLPITNEADESYTRMLEAYAENAMVTRDHFIRTGKMPDKIQIGLASKNLEVTQVLGLTYVSITNSK